MRRLAALTALLLAACNGGSGPPAATEPIVDFLLQDVNPNSPTNGMYVSPRDYLGQVSAWYFGDAL
jgi:hypothetical protein